MQTSINFVFVGHVQYALVVFVVQIFGWPSIRWADDEVYIMPTHGDTLEAQMSCKLAQTVHLRPWLLIKFTWQTPCTTSVQHTLSFKPEFLVQSLAACLYMPLRLPPLQPPLTYPFRLLCYPHDIHTIMKCLGKFCAWVTWTKPVGKCCPPLAYCAIKLKVQYHLFLLSASMLLRLGDQFLQALSEW